jgi:hypothetical protein
MGLDTTHDCWHGAYSAFSRWRQKLAAVAGYAIWPVKWDDGTVMDTVMLDWGHLPDNALNGEWPETPTDPLIVLIAHSDCEGVIHPQQAGPLADRLAELLPLLPEENDPGHIGNWRAKTFAFISGLRIAHHAGEDVEFH